MYIVGIFFGVILLSNALSCYAMEERFTKKQQKRHEEWFNAVEKRGPKILKALLQKKKISKGELDYLVVSAITRRMVNPKYRSTWNIVVATCSDDTKERYKKHQGNLITLEQIRNTVNEKWTLSGKSPFGTQWYCCPIMKYQDDKTSILHILTDKYRIIVCSTRRSENTKKSVYDTEINICKRMCNSYLVKAIFDFLGGKDELTGQYVQYYLSHTGFLLIDYITEEGELSARRVIKPRKKPKSIFFDYDEHGSVNLFGITFSSSYKWYLAMEQSRDECQVLRRKIDNNGDFDDEVRMPIFFEWNDYTVNGEVT